MDLTSAMSWPQVRLGDAGAMPLKAEVTMAQRGAHHSNKMDKGTQGKHTCSYELAWLGWL